MDDYLLGYYRIVHKAHHDSIDIYSKTNNLLKYHISKSE
jgi:hypothetical protein